MLWKLLWPARPNRAARRRRAFRPALELLEDRWVPVRFAVIGDYGLASTNEQNVANLVAGWSPDFVITAGDNNYPSGAQATIDPNIGQYYHSYISPYTGSYGAGAASNQFWPSLGNHDWDTSGATPYLNYFTLPNNERYYEFRPGQGPVDFFAMDSDSHEPDGNTSTSIQATWLQNQLAASTAAWKLVYFHHPPYSSTSVQSTWMQWPFQSWGASAVLSGHAHVYERLIEDSNFPYFVNGLGGDDKASFGTVVAGSQVRYNSDFGAQLVTGDSNSLTFQFYSQSGVFIDSYTLYANPEANLPLAPAYLTVTAASSAQLNLTWATSSNNSDQFAIERSTDGFTFTQIATIQGTSYADTGLTAGTRYYYRVRASDNAGYSGYSGVANGIARGAAAQLGVSAAATSTTAGTALNVTVIALDSYVNQAPGYTGTIHFSSSDGQAVLPADYTFTSSDAGSHTFSVTLKTAVSQSLTVSDTVTSSITGTQTGISVTPAAASTLSVSAPASSPTGGAFSVTVTALDAYSNTATGYTGTVNFTSSDTAARLPANYTYTSTDKGVHTFTNGVTLNTVGTPSVTATDTVTSSITGTARVSVTSSGTPAAPTGLTATAATTATSQINLAWTDNANNETGYKIERSTDNITFTQITTTAANVTSYSNTGLTAGTKYYYRVRATNATADSSYSNVASDTGRGAATQLRVSASTFFKAGSVSVIVTALDSYGNAAPTYTGKVHFSSSDAKAVLPADYTFTSTDAGSHTFSVTFKTSNVQSLTASDTVTSSISGTLSGIDVKPQDTSQFKVSGFPSPITAGVAGYFMFAALDKYGNIQTGSTRTANFTSSDSQAVLPASYTLTTGLSADNGLHIFSATLKTAGSQSITASDPDAAQSGVTSGTQTGITVNPAAASTLTVAGFPSPVIAGTAGTVTVTAKDIYGNTATGYTGTVTFSSSDSQAVLPANYTFTSSDVGMHTFTNGVTLKTAGSQSVTATDTLTITITGKQAGIIVNPAAASTLTVSGFPATMTAGTAGSVTVTAKDVYGNTATGYTGTVHVTSSDGQAVLPANYTFTSSDTGAHTFTNGVTLKTVGSQSVTAADTVTGSITGTESGITVNPAAASTLTVASFPSPVTAGTAGSVTVTAKDAYGNTAIGYTGTVAFTSSDGQAVLPANYTLTSSDAGAHTFTNGVTLKTAGSQSITATDTLTGSINGKQSGISVNAAAVNHLAVSAPSSATAGTAFSVTVTAQDAYNNTATSYTGTVAFTSSDSQAALPVNYIFTSSDAGAHTFTNGVTLKTAGSQMVTATDALTSSITGSATLTVSAAAASTLTVAGFPTTVTAGTAGTVTVTAKDPYGNTATGYTGTVAFTSSDSQAALPANYIFTSSDAGAHTFTNGVTLKTAGSRSITATDTLTSSITGMLGGISVNAAAASTLNVSAPASSTAGIAFSVTVTAKDAYGNTASGYTGTVSFSSSDGQAALPANYIFTSTDAGLHTFTNGVTLKTAGSQSITATDTLISSITGSATVSVATSTSTHFSVSAPSSSTAGSAFSVTVTALDASNNTLTTYTGTVAFSSSDGQAVLPANYTFTSSDAGMHTFTNGVTLKTAGSQSITATDTLTSTITGSATLTVSAAAASTLTVAGFPPSVTAGTAGSFTVTAKDAYGNTATTYAGTVSFSSSDGQATLPSNYTFTTSDAGVHTVSATLKTAGTQSLTATDTVTSSITGSQAGITVNPAAASTLIVNGFPSLVTAGVAGNFTLTAKDAYGNTASGYTGTVHITNSDGQAALPADYAFTAADVGVHSFSATLKTAGTQSLTATDTVTSSINGSQTGITVNPAAAATFVVAGFPATVTAGTPGSFTVTAKDAYGNTATTYTGTVSFSSSDGQATLPSNYTFTTSDAGVHTVSTTLKTAGTQSLTATDTVTSSITGSQAGITVNPAAASTLTVGGFPATVTAGTAGSVTVTAKDVYGNTATGYTGTVHVTSSDGQAVLPANYTFTSSDTGAHTFTNGVTLKTVGSQSVTAADTVTGSITGTESGITVNPAAASTLTVASFPSPVTAGTAGSVTVTAKDAYGNTAIGYTGTVAFTSSDSQAVLPVNYAFTSADAGVHTFTSSVTIKTAGSQSITATDTLTGSINGKQSGITVNAAALNHLAVSAPSSATAGTAFSVTVTAQDAYNNNTTTYTGTVAFTSSDGQAVLPANYTFTSADAGVHAFTSGVTLKTAGSQSITATDTLTSSITGSATLTANPAAANHLNVSAPASAAKNKPFTITVTAQDQYNNTATSYTGTVTFSSSDGSASLPKNYTFTSSDAGVHTFTNGVTLKTTGNQTITATDKNSSSITGTATVNVTSTHTGTTASSPNQAPSGFGPQQIRHAYGFDQLPFDGSGQTIAVVDAYDDPNLFSDLDAFDRQFPQVFGPNPAPASSFLAVVNQNGLPPSDSSFNVPADPSGTWEMEEALDVESAHAVAPKAKILLVEANSGSDSDLLQAVDAARTYPGVVVVSMSWGSGVPADKSSSDRHFTTPAGHTGVTFLAASGDDGTPADWPALSPNVVAVGGTALALDSSANRISETGWGGSGGGYSNSSSTEPSYQSNYAQSSYVQNTLANRVLGHALGKPDVSYAAAGSPGFAVYNTYPSDLGDQAWWAVGGTSAGAPQWAGLIALVAQGRGRANGSLDGATQTLPALYQLAARSASSATDFYDVTSGGNGPNSLAEPGYDLVTGLGSPKADKLVPDLIRVRGSAARDGTLTFSTTVVTPGGAALAPATASARLPKLLTAPALTRAGLTAQTTSAGQAATAIPLAGFLPAVPGSLLVSVAPDQLNQADLGFGGAVAAAGPLPAAPARPAASLLESHRGEDAVLPASEEVDQWAERLPLVSDPDTPRSPVPQAPPDLTAGTQDAALWHEARAYFFADEGWTADQMDPSAVSPPIGTARAGPASAPVDWDVSLAVALAYCWSAPSRQPEPRPRQQLVRADLDGFSRPGPAAGAMDEKG